MKVRALVSISGPKGHKSAGDEFTVDASEGKELVDRKLVEAVVETPALSAGKDTKPAKTDG